MGKRALVTGITGQDGSYLAEFLLEKGYEVHGITRRTSTLNRARIEKIYFDLLKKDAHKGGKLKLHYGDMTDVTNLGRILQETQPEEIYNLAAQSHVKISFEIPEHTSDVNGMGVLRLLELVRTIWPKNGPKIYQASTSELFGKVLETPQKETTPFYPRSPYGVSKLYAYWIIQNYREAYGLFACNGILFNHESERRGENFVTRKITIAAARIAKGLQDKVYLGNLNAKRDWGYAKDYVECMWMILQQSAPDDYVIATGQTHTVREFATLAFREAGIELEWKGEGVNEKGAEKKTGRVLVEVDPQHFRPTEVDVLIGDPSKAKKKLGWNPTKTSFEDLVRLMVRHDLAHVS